MSEQKPTRQQLLIAMERAGAKMATLLMVLAQDETHVPAEPMRAVIDLTRSGWDRACGDWQQVAALTGEQPTADQQAAGSVEAVRSALRKAYNLGQTYWQQADSEYRSENKKSDATAAKFVRLIDDTVAQIAALDSRAQPVAAGELPKLPQPSWVYIDVARDGQKVPCYSADQMHRYAHEHADNTPWLRLAHIICADAGIPPGRIDDRLEALRDKLDEYRADSRPAGGVADLVPAIQALDAKSYDAIPSAGFRLGFQAAREAAATLAASAALPAAEQDDVAKDAARYRWLRDKNNLEASRLIEFKWGEQLDAAIDAAAQPVDGGQEANHG